MTCIKVRQKLNEAILKGENYIVLDNLSENNIEELKECGFIVVKQKNKFKIML